MGENPLKAWKSLLSEVPFQQAPEGYAGPYRSEVFFRISSVFSINREFNS